MDLKALNNFSFFFKTPKSLSIEGKIKESAEDFVVKEIFIDNTIADESTKYLNICKEGKFLYFILIKKNWSTDMALRVIAKRLGISYKRFNYAGNKDKKALTYQFCSAYAINELNVNIKDISIMPLCKGSEKISMGMLKGNKFIIKVRELNEDAPFIIERIVNELNASFPNYYGMQRFGGVRRNNHIIGYLLLKGLVKEAVWTFLTQISNKENQQAKEAREHLKEERDFKNALSYFPKFLKHERLILSHLARYPNDFINAFRRLPRQTLLLFIHAIQAYIFNNELSLRIKEDAIKPLENEIAIGKDPLGFPNENKEGNLILANVVGYKSQLNAYEEQILDELSLDVKDFYIKNFPELSSKGSKRLLFSPIIDFVFNKDTFFFKLSKGSYATSLLREFFKKEL